MLILYQEDAKLHARIAAILPISPLMLVFWFVLMGSLLIVIQANVKLYARMDMRIYIKGDV